MEKSVKKYLCIARQVFDCIRIQQLMNDWKGDL